MKVERSECLWAALERFIPDIRQRTELTMIGSPLTHERFLRRCGGVVGRVVKHAGGDILLLAVRWLYVYGWG
jgi:hypothetical protein